MILFYEEHLLDEDVHQKNLEGAKQFGTAERVDYSEKNTGVLSVTLKLCVAVTCVLMKISSL